MEEVAPWSWSWRTLHQDGRREHVANGGDGCWNWWAPLDRPHDCLCGRSVGIGGGLSGRGSTGLHCQNLGNIRGGKGDWAGKTPEVLRLWDWSWTSRRWIPDLPAHVWEGDGAEMGDWEGDRCSTLQAQWRWWKSWGTSWSHRHKDCPGHGWSATLVDNKNQTWLSNECVHGVQVGYKTSKAIDWDRNPGDAVCQGAPWRTPLHKECAHGPVWNTWPVESGKTSGATWGVLRHSLWGGNTKQKHPGAGHLLWWMCDGLANNSSALCDAFHSREWAGGLLWCAECWAICWGYVGHDDGWSFWHQIHPAYPLRRQCGCHWTCTWYELFFLAHQTSQNQGIVSSRSSWWNCSWRCLEVAPPEGDWARSRWAYKASTWPSFSGLCGRPWDETKGAWYRRWRWW